MILIADSGSTKCDWVAIDDDGKSVVECSTAGLNPFFHDTSSIADTIKNSEDLLSIKDQVRELHFYGAGVSSDHMNQIIANGIGAVFSSAKINPQHDLLGAALATYNGEPCIFCILGTGSNSAHFDGENLTEVHPALSYVLGDEGGGTFYGKTLLVDFLYNRLPADLQQDFAARYSLDKDMVLERIYMQPRANVFLASFAIFLSYHRDHEYVEALLHKGMTDFLSTHVCCFENFKDVETHFVGSVAYTYQDALREAAAELGVNIGNVIRKPIDGLIKYHTQGHPYQA